MRRESGSRRARSVREAPVEISCVHSGNNRGGILPRSKRKRSAPARERSDSLESSGRLLLLLGGFLARLDHGVRHLLDAAPANRAGRECALEGLFLAVGS